MPAMTTVRRAPAKREPSLINTIQFLEERLTVASIMQPTEPSLGVLRAKDLLARMDEDGFDHVAIADHNNVSRYISRSDLENAKNKTVLECSHIISAANLVADSCPLADALPRIIENGFLLVLRGKAIDHIVTTADLDRLPVTMYFMSVLYAFEETLTTRLYALSDAEVQGSLETWMAGIEDATRRASEQSKLSESIRSFERKRRNRQELRLVNCLHLLHKMQLLKRSRPDWWKPLKSANEADASASLDGINALRNVVAHGEVLATSTTGWKDALRTVRVAQAFAECLAAAHDSGS